jgi:sugar phosphate permease
MEFNSFTRYFLVSTLSFATMVSAYWIYYGEIMMMIFIVSFLMAVFCYVPMVIVGKLTIDAIAKVPYGNAASFALFVVSQYLVGLSEILLIDWLFLGDWAITTSLIHVACIVSFLLGIFSTRKSFYQYKTSLHEQYLV